MWSDNCDVFCSLRSRRLEVVGTRKNGRPEGDTRGERELPHPSRVSLARVRSLFRRVLPGACYAGYKIHHNCKYFALTQSVLYVLKARFAPPPKKKKKIIANHGELKESHFEISHSISPSNNQGHPTTVSS